MPMTGIDDVIRLYAVTDEQAIKDVVGELRAQGLNGTGNRLVGDFDLNQLLREYQISSWIYTAVQTTAEHLGCVPLKAGVLNSDGVFEPMPNSPMQRILDEPNPFESQNEMVEQLVINLQLTGSMFCAVERANSLQGGSGAVTSLRSLRPSRIEINPGAGHIESFNYDAGQGRVVIPWKNMVYGRHYHPLNDYWGLSPIEPIAISSNLDQRIQTYHDKHLKGGGRFDVILSSPETLDADAAARILVDWKDSRQNPEETGNAFLADGAVKVTSAEFAPKEMEFQQLGRVEKLRILAVLKCPPLLAGDLADSSLLQNTDVQLQIFKAHLMALGKLIANPFTRLARLLFGPRWVVMFDFNGVELFEEPMTQRWTRVTAAWDSGILKLDEARKDLGKPPVGGEEGDGFKQPAMPMAPPGQEPPQEEEEDEEKAIAAGPFRDGIKSATLAAISALESVHERKIQKAAATAFREQGDRVITRLSNTKAHRDQDFADETLLQLLFPTDEEDAALASKLEPVMAEAFLDSGRVNFKAASKQFDEDGSEALAWAEQWAALRVRGINDETRKSIRDILVEAIEDDLPRAAIERRVARLFARFATGRLPDGAKGRAAVIAQTEITAALNGGQLAGLNAAVNERPELRPVKAWGSRRDPPRARENHMSLDAETRSQPIEAGETFANGLQFPGDPAGDASETVNCRCILLTALVEQ